MKELFKVKIMDNELQLYVEGNEKYFSASEVGKMLDYSIANISKMVKTVDDEEKKLEFVARNNSMSNDKRKKEQWFVTKDGLYELLFQSRKPIAKEFKKEIKRILKEIENNGYYISTGKDEKWLGARNDGKEIRRDETDTIKEFVELAKSQGSSKPNWYYKHFTNLVRNKLEIPKLMERDDMNQKTIFDIQCLERLISMKLKTLILENKNYKEIYEIIKEMIKNI